MSKFLLSGPIASVTPTLISPRTQSCDPRLWSAMAAGGQEDAMEKPEEFDMDGLDIDAMLAEPEAHVRQNPIGDHGTSLEGHAPTFLHGPIRPSAEDVDRHDATHVPYRNWCPAAHRVNTKGPTDEWIAKRLVKDIEELGRGDIILKTDGEPDMLALQKAMAVLRKELITRP